MKTFQVGDLIRTKTETPYDGVITAVYIAPTETEAGMYNIRLARGTACWSGRDLEPRE